jgi:hypothetical protein
LWEAAALDRQTLISGVRAKQYLALRIKAAFSRYKGWVLQASIVQGAVPAASLSPFAPLNVIAIFAVGISSLPGRTKQALGGIAWAGQMPSHCGACRHGKKDRGRSNQCKFRHSFLPRLRVSKIAKYP